MRTKMKKILSILLSLIMALGLVQGIGMTVLADDGSSASCYTIKFKSTNKATDSSVEVSGVNVDLIIESVSPALNFTEAELYKVFNAKTGYGIKLGSSKAAGSMTLRFLTPILAESIVVNAAQYNDNENTLYIEGDSYTTDGDFRDYTYTYSEPTEISSITLASSERIYVFSLTINTGSTEVPTHSVILTGGANATTSGGETEQTGLTGEMEPVTYTADAGYCFEDFDVISAFGITAEKTGDTVVTVSGSPTADVHIEIPDAVIQLIPHSHDGATFVPWTQEDTLPDEAGNYYLENDVQIGDTWSPKGTVNLCLNGHGILMTGNGSVVAVGSGVTLDLYDCNAGQRTNYIRYSYWQGVERVSGEPDTVSLDGYGSGIAAVGGGYITGGTGTASTNTFANKKTGGGVYVDGGTFHMHGGTITGCRTHSGNGGAVAVINNGKFTLSGGSIIKNMLSRNNAGEGHGAGVVVHGSEFTMTGGLISENQGRFGAVSLLKDSSASISGGSITDNTVDMGIHTNGSDGAISLAISGGTVTGNGNYAVSLQGNEDDSFKLSGDPELVGSKAGIRFETELPLITIDGELTGSEPYVVSMKTPGVFTDGANPDCTDPERFASGDEGLLVYANDDGQLVLGKMPATAPDVTANDGEADGTARPLVTVAGEAVGGTMWYAVGENADSAPSYDGDSQSGGGTWSTSIPTGTEAGTYFVWYKVVGDENHLDTEPQCVEVVIGGEHVHRYDRENPSWRWKCEDGKWSATAAYRCSCGETEVVEAIVDEGVRDTDSNTVTYTATEGENTVSRTNRTDIIVSYNGTDRTYDYGATCKLTAAVVSDWKVKPKDGTDEQLSTYATGTKEFYFAVTEDVEVRSETSESAEQVAMISASDTASPNKLTYVVTWSLPKGAQVKSTMIYRAKDNKGELEGDAEGLLAADNLRTYNMNLNVRNGKYTYTATGLSTDSYQTVMAQVVYKLDRKTYTKHTAPKSCGPF